MGTGIALTERFKGMKPLKDVCLEKEFGQPTALDTALSELLGKCSLEITIDGKRKSASSKGKCATKVAPSTSLHRLFSKNPRGQATDGMKSHQTVSRNDRESKASSNVAKSRQLEHASKDIPVHGNGTTVKPGGDVATNKTIVAGAPAKFQQGAVMSNRTRQRDPRLIYGNGSYSLAAKQTFGESISRDSERVNQQKRSSKPGTRWGKQNPDVKKIDSEGGNLVKVVGPSEKSTGKTALQTSDLNRQVIKGLGSFGAIIKKGSEIPETATSASKGLVPLATGVGEKPLKGILKKNSNEVPLFSTQMSDISGIVPASSLILQSGSNSENSVGIPQVIGQIVKSTVQSSEQSTVSKPVSGNSNSRSVPILQPPVNVIQHELENQMSSLAGGRPGKSISDNGDVVIKDGNLSKQPQIKISAGTAPIVFKLSITQSIDNGQLNLKLVSSPEEDQQGGNPPKIGAQDEIQLSVDEAQMPNLSRDEVRPVHVIHLQHQVSSQNEMLTNNSVIGNTVHISSGENSVTQSSSTVAVAGSKVTPQNEKTLLVGHPHHSGSNSTLHHRENPAITKSYVNQNSEAKVKGVWPPFQLNRKPSALVMGTDSLQALVPVVVNKTQEGNSSTVQSKEEIDETPGAKKKPIITYIQRVVTKRDTSPQNGGLHTASQIKLSENPRGYLTGNDQDNLDIVDMDISSSPIHSVGQFVKSGIPLSEETSAIQEASHEEPKKVTELPCDTSKSDALNVTKMSNCLEDTKLSRDKNDLNSSVEASQTENKDVHHPRWTTFLQEDTNSPMKSALGSFTEAVSSLTNKIQSYAVQQDFSCVSSNETSLLDQPPNSVVQDVASLISKDESDRINEGNDGTSTILPSLDDPLQVTESIAVTHHNENKLQNNPVMEGSSHLDETLPYGSNGKDSSESQGSQLEDTLPYGEKEEKSAVISGGESMIQESDEIKEKPVHQIKQNTKVITSTDKMDKLPTDMNEDGKRDNMEKNERRSSSPGTPLADERDVFFKEKESEISLDLKEKVHASESSDNLSSAVSDDQNNNSIVECKVSPLQKVNGKSKEESVKSKGKSVKSRKEKPVKSNKENSAKSSVKSNCKPTDSDVKVAGPVYLRELSNVSDISDISMSGDELPIEESPENQEPLEPVIVRGTGKETYGIKQFVNKTPDRSTPEKKNLPKKNLYVDRDMHKRPFHKGFTYKRSPFFRKNMYNIHEERKRFRAFEASRGETREMPQKPIYNIANRQKQMMHRFGNVRPPFNPVQQRQPQNFARPGNGGNFEQMTAVQALQLQINAAVNPAHRTALLLALQALLCPQPAPCPPQIRPPQIRPTVPCSPVLHQTVPCPPPIHQQVHVPCQSPPCNNMDNPNWNTRGPPNRLPNSGNMPIPMSSRRSPGMHPEEDLANRKVEFTVVLRNREREEFMKKPAAGADPVRQRRHSYEDERIHEVPSKYHHNSKFHENSGYDSGKTSESSRHSSGNNESVQSYKFSDNRDSTALKGREVSRSGSESNEKSADSNTLKHSSNMTSQRHSPSPTEQSSKQRKSKRKDKKFHGRPLIKDKTNIIDPHPIPLNNTSEKVGGDDPRRSKSKTPDPGDSKKLEQLKWESPAQEKTKSSKKKSKKRSHKSKKHSSKHKSTKKSAKISKKELPGSDKQSDESFSAKDENEFQNKSDAAGNANWHLEKLEGMEVPLHEAKQHHRSRLCDERDNNSIPDPRLQQTIEDFVSKARKASSQASEHQMGNTEKEERKVASESSVDAPKDNLPRHLSEDQEIHRNELLQGKLKGMENITDVDDNMKEKEKSGKSHRRKSSTERKIRSEGPKDSGKHKDKDLPSSAEETLTRAGESKKENATKMEEGTKPPIGTSKVSPLPCKSADEVKGIVSNSKDDGHKNNKKEGSKILHHLRTSPEGKSGNESQKHSRRHKEGIKEMTTEVPKASNQASKSSEEGSSHEVEGEGISSEIIKVNTNKQTCQRGDVELIGNEVLAGEPQNEQLSDVNYKKEESGKSSTSRTERKSRSKSPNHSRHNHKIDASSSGSKKASDPSTESPGGQDFKEENHHPPSDIQKAITKENNDEDRAESIIKQLKDKDSKGKQEKREELDKSNRRRTPSEENVRHESSEHSRRHRQNEDERGDYRYKSRRRHHSDADNGRDGSKEPPYKMRKFDHSARFSDGNEKFSRYNDRQRHWSPSFRYGNRGGSHSFGRGRGRGGFRGRFRGGHRALINSYTPCRPEELRSAARDYEVIPIKSLKELGFTSIVTWGDIHVAMSDIKTRMKTVENASRDVRKASAAIQITSLVKIRDATDAALRYIYKNIHNLENNLKHQAYLHRRKYEVLMADIRIHAEVLVKLLSPEQSEEVMSGFADNTTGIRNIDPQVEMKVLSWLRHRSFAAMVLNCKDIIVNKMRQLRFETIPKFSNDIDHKEYKDRSSNRHIHKRHPSDSYKSPDTTQPDGTEGRDENVPGVSSSPTVVSCPELGSTTPDTPCSVLLSTSRSEPRPRTETLTDASRLLKQVDSPSQVFRDPPPVRRLLCNSEETLPFSDKPLASKSSIVLDLSESHLKSTKQTREESNKKKDVAEEHFKDSLKAADSSTCHLKTSRSDKARSASETDTSDGVGSGSNLITRTSISCPVLAYHGKPVFSATKANTSSTLHSLHQSPVLKASESTKDTPNKMNAKVIGGEIGDSAISGNISCDSISSTHGPGLPIKSLERQKSTLTSLKHSPHSFKGSAFLPRQVSIGIASGNGSSPVIPTHLTSSIASHGSISSPCVQGSPVKMIESPVSSKLSPLELYPGLPYFHKLSVAKKDWTPDAVNLPPGVGSNNSHMTTTSIGHGLKSPHKQGGSETSPQMLSSSTTPTGFAQSGLTSSNEYSTRVKRLACQTMMAEETEKYPKKSRGQQRSPAKADDPSRQKEQMVKYTSSKSPRYSKKSHILEKYHSDGVEGSPKTPKFGLKTPKKSFQGNLDAMYDEYEKSCMVDYKFGVKASETEKSGSTFPVTDGSDGKQSLTPVESKKDCTNAS